MFGEFDFRNHRRHGHHAPNGNILLLGLTRRNSGAMVIRDWQIAHNTYISVSIFFIFKCMLFI